MTWKGHSLPVMKSTSASQSTAGSIRVKEIISSRFRIESSWTAKGFFTIQDVMVV